MASDKAIGYQASDAQRRIDMLASAGKQIRDAAVRLCEDAESPARDDGYVLIKKGDLEALAEALIIEHSLLPEPEEANDGADAAKAANVDNAERFAPGTHGCHEALHMAFVSADLVAERLCEHPAIKLRAGWQDLADKAHQTLFDLYQAIGKEHM